VYGVWEFLGKNPPNQNTMSLYCVTLMSACIQGFHYVSGWHVEANCFASVFVKYWQFPEKDKEGEHRDIIHYRVRRLEWQL
jgi:hypothetical protein